MHQRNPLSLHQRNPLSLHQASPYPCIKHPLIPASTYPLIHASTQSLIPASTHPLIPASMRPDPCINASLPLPRHYSGRVSALCPITTYLFMNYTISLLLLLPSISDVFVCRSFWVSLSRILNMETFNKLFCNVSRYLIFVASKI